MDHKPLISLQSLCTSSQELLTYFILFFASFSILSFFCLFLVYAFLHFLQSSAISLVFWLSRFDYGGSGIYPDIFVFFLPPAFIFFVFVCFIKTDLCSPWINYLGLLSLYQVFACFWHFDSQFDSNFLLLITH